MSTPDITNGTARNHTHPNSARVRNDGSSFMDAYGLLTGHRTYFLQRSAADVRHGRAGCRTFHWAKDLTVTTEKFNPEETDILCMVDVDMYMDIPKLLTNVFQPLLISTFCPSSVAKSTGEYSYTFNSNGTVKYDVSGGATYEHQVWNYGVDTTMAVSYRLGLFRINIYNVDRRRLDDDHQLILLTPIKQIITPIWSNAWLGGHSISRLNIVESVEGVDYLRMDVQTKTGLLRSTGRCGTFLSATIKAEEDDTLASMARNSKTVDLTIASIKTAVKDVNQADATILCEYHRKKTGDKPPVVYPVEHSVQRFQFLPSDYDPTAKSSLTPFMHPVLLGCFAPDVCKSNDIQAVNARIKDVAPKSDMTISAKMLMYMEEFISFLVPEPLQGHPVDFEAVWDKQGKPSQRRILEKAGQISGCVDGDPIQSFQKAEAYTKLTDPRIISTIPGVAKFNYSRYIYSFTTVLRATLWYAFGRTPLEIASRVGTICGKASWTTMTDLSRFDGRVSIVLRTLERMLMLRYFHAQYHRELTELMASQQDQRAYTKFGVKYPTGTSRASGSPETADFNSTDNAFMAYVSLRRTIHNNVVYSPKEAWDLLGIYGGDDGITPDVDAKQYETTCAEVGQVLEIDEIKRGEIGVTFLSRYYGPEVWHGATDSMCDLPRQLTKLHVTPSLPSNVTPLQKFSEKIYSYYLTDKSSPIIGPLSTALVRHFPFLVPKERNAHGLATYASLTDESSQYPNTYGDWMMDLTNKWVPEFNHDLFNKWLETVVSSKDAQLFLKVPLCGSLEVKQQSKSEVVVNGEVIPASQPSAPPEPKPAKASIKPSKEKEKKPFSEEDLKKMATMPCKLGKECKYGAKCRFKH